MTELTLARRHALLIGFVLALIVLTATAGAGGGTSSNRVLVIGDSILHLSQGDVAQALSADGWHPVVDGRPGLSMESWEQLVGGDAAIARPDVAVVELGTNDCDTSCNNLGPVIDTIMGQLVSQGAGTVYWLNVQTNPTNIDISHPGVPRVYPTHADYVNYAIEQAAVRWPQMKVVDLRDLFDRHPEWHQADGLHPNAIGQQELATLISTAIHR